MTEQEYLLEMIDGRLVDSWERRKLSEWSRWLARSVGKQFHLYKQGKTLVVVEVLGLNHPGRHASRYGPPVIRVREVDTGTEYPAALDQVIPIKPVRAK